MVSSTNVSQTQSDSEICSTWIRIHFRRRILSYHQNPLPHHGLTVLYDLYCGDMDANSQRNVLFDLFLTLLNEYEQYLLSIPANERFPEVLTLPNQVIFQVDRVEEEEEEADNLPDLVSVHDGDEEFLNLLIFG